VDAFRFQNVNAPAPEQVPNRLGFKRLDENHTIEFIFPKDVMRDEVLKGFNVQSVLNELKKRNFLKIEPGRLTVKREVPDFPAGTRFYCVRAAILGEGDTGCGETGERGETF
jgi:hypothetical protein